jgi:hypothetical protein
MFLKDKYLASFERFHHDFYRLLLTALSRWPYKHRGVVYRGITVGENEQLKRIVDSPEELLKEGTVLTFASFTSASTNKQVAERFARGIFYEIRGAEGYDIQCLSVIPREFEVLIAPPTCVVVESFRSQPGRLNINLNISPSSVGYM